MHKMFVAFVCIVLLPALSVANGEPISTFVCNPQADCGCSQNSAVLTRIVGGEPAISDSFDWAVSIRIYGSHICGGSVITDSFVITAAHCIPGSLGLNKITIVAGINLLSTTGQTRSVIQAYIHPNFDSASFTNDIAILRLDTPLNRTDPHIKRICLPTATDNLTPGMNLVAIGWGVTFEGGYVATNELRQVTIQVFDNQSPECKVVLRSSAVQFCAGVADGSKDSCSGDSGGPLMAFLNNRWILMGIISSGHGCGRAGFAGIYTRVSALLEYIRSIVQNI